MKSSFRPIDSAFVDLFFERDRLRGKASIAPTELDRCTLRRTKLPELEEYHLPQTSSSRR